MFRGWEERISISWGGINGGILRIFFTSQGSGVCTVAKIPEVKVKSNISKAQPVFQAPKPQNGSPNLNLSPSSLEIPAIMMPSPSLVRLRNENESRCQAS